MSRFFDDLRADYQVNTRFIDRTTVTAFRLNQASYRGRFRLPKRLAAKAFDTLWLQLVVGADLDGRATVGPGLKLPHGGRLVGIDPGAVMGKGVTLFPNSGVARGGPSRGSAVVGDNVTIGRNGGAIGPVTIGDGATIAINSITYRTVAPGETVVGNPARPIREAVTPHTRPASTRFRLPPGESKAESSGTPTRA